MTPSLHKGDALVVVDAQIDFFPGGALPVPHGDRIIPVVNQWLEAASVHQIPIFASRDWHPATHVSFKKRGGPWPVHCVQDSEGAKFHPNLHFPHDTIVISKADDPDADTYSAFEGTTGTGETLHHLLQKLEVQRIWLCGLTLEYCVFETALDARRHGYEVQIIPRGTLPVDETAGRAASISMREVGVVI